MTGREGRLKPEFAQVYPALEAGKWESAGVLADKELPAKAVGRRRA